jgi:hypothetical protein
MSKERASLGFGDELEEFNPADWTPKPPTNANAKPDPAASRKAAEASGFQSREPKPAPVPAESAAGQSAPRRRRTAATRSSISRPGPETIEAFVAIADRQGRPW